MAPAELTKMQEYFPGPDWEDVVMVLDSLDELLKEEFTIFTIVMSRLLSLVTTTSFMVHTTNGEGKPS